ncbi:MAG: DNA polymerase III subunit beta [Patescibacteria group bacterium]
MKFICTQENLHQGLLMASHINTRNINLPILNNVLLKVEDNTLKLVSTNLELALITRIRGKADENGEYTVPAKLLSDYVSFLPKETISLELEDGFLHVSCGNHKTKIKGIPTEDFPIIPQIEKKSTFFVDGPDFKRALSQVSFAVLPNEARPEISGVFIRFNFESGRVALVATDSFRLAEKKIDLSEKSSKEDISVIIPLRTIWELNNILSVVSGESDLLEISLDEGQVYFKYNNTELTSRLVEGMFPDYIQIIPKDFNTEATVPVKELLIGTKSASLFSRSGLNDVKLNFLSAEGFLEIYSTDNHTGEQKTRVLGEIKGIANKIVLNHKYLVDGLSNLGSEKLVMRVIDENNSCVMRPAEKDNYLYIVMPIKQ